MIRVGCSGRRVARPALLSRHWQQGEQPGELPLPAALSLSLAGACQWAASAAPSDDNFCTVSRQRSPRTPPTPIPADRPAPPANGALVPRPLGRPLALPCALAGRLPTGVQSQRLHYTTRVMQSPARTPLQCSPLPTAPRRFIAGTPQAALHTPPARGYLPNRADKHQRRARHLLRPPRKGERQARRGRAAGAASAATRGRRTSGGAARASVLCAVAHEDRGPADESTGDATRDGDIDGHERRAKA